MFDNSLKNILVITTLLFSLSYEAQEIDPSILKDISPDQIKRAQEMYSKTNNEDIKKRITDNSDEEDFNESINNDESLVLKEEKEEEEEEKEEEFNIEECLKNAFTNKEIRKCNEKQEELENAIEKFGYDFFNLIPTSTTAVGDLPLPNDYRISLKDQFTIIYTGSKETILDLRVKLDGTILLPEIGSIQVAGDTFDSVRKKITNRINESYIGVNVDVAIKNLSAKKISVVGAVNTPGTYLVNPFTTITSALAYSGGIQEIGTLRNIKLIKSSGEIYNFDLYDLLIYGDRSNDLTVDAGDTVLIGPALNFVKLTGSINRPMIYETIESDTLDDIIKYGLGLKNSANPSNILISKLNIIKSSIDKISTGDLSTSLKNAVSVNVYEYRNLNSSGIEIYGAVKQPGNYPSKFNTLEELINSMEFIDVYPFMAILERFNNETLERNTILFNLNDVNTYKDIYLTNNSKIFFFEIQDSKHYIFDEFEEVDFIPAIEDLEMSDMSKLLVKSFSLSMQHKDGNFMMPVVGSFAVKNFINYLGLDMTYAAKEATFISAGEEKVIIQDYNSMNFSSKKFQTVLFKNELNNLINVTVEGAINYPGLYTITPGTSVNDLYQQLGGFRDTANLSAVVYKRLSLVRSQLNAIEKSKKDISNAIQTRNIAENQNNNIDPSIMSALTMEIDESNLGRVSGDFTPNSDGAINTILRDGDSIFIPMKSNTVSVLGEVLNPSSFAFDENINVNDAIQQAGGFKQTALKTGIYIIHADGLVDKKRRNIFAGSLDLRPGDTIVVPRDFSSPDDTLNYIGSITQVLSDLAFSASALDNLKNN
tara:strand:+ start:40293 stop:42755 length:2463 start_codon:yes stop_codon:yes gene_type:complete